MPDHPLQAVHAQIEQARIAAWNQYVQGIDPAARASGADTYQALCNVKAAIEIEMGKRSLQVPFFGL